MSIIKLLKFEEGIRLKPYKCTAGKTTIGYGRNLDDKGISLNEAGTMLNNDVAECVALVSKSLPWSSALDMVRRDVLVAMCFQLGLNGLLSFNNFLKAMRDGNWLAAAAELRNSRFHTQTPSRVDRLIFMLVNGEDVEQAK